MKYLISSGVLVVCLCLNLQAQETDTLLTDSLYIQGLSTALHDGQIQPEEQALLGILARSRGLSTEQARRLERKFRLLSPEIRDQNGRWPLVLQNMTWGAGLYGWGIPSVLDVKDPKWYVGTEMLSLAVTFSLTQRYTKEMDISYARAQMSRTGSMLGLRYGVGLSSILKLSEKGDGDGPILLAMTGVPVGMKVGDMLWKRWDPSHGASWSLSLWTTIGASTLRLSHHLVDPQPEVYIDQPGSYYDEEEVNPDWEDWRRRATMVELVGYPLGMWWGHRFNQSRNLTFGDAFLLTQSWGYGWMVSMLSIDMLLGVDNLDGDMFVWLGNAGAMGMVYYYDRLIADADYTFGQAFLETLGAGAGLMAGFGVGIIAEPGDKMSQLLALTGYGTGVYLSHRLFKPAAEGSLSEAGGPQLNLTFLPLPGPRQTPIPGVAASLRF